MRDPESLAEALTLLAAGDGEAKLLAGGQSLVPMLNMRLVRPAVLVDLNAVPGLDGIAAAPDGGLTIGALARHADVAASPLVHDRAPLLAEAARHVGHRGHPQPRHARRQPRPRRSRRGAARRPRGPRLRARPDRAGRRPLGPGVRVLSRLALDRARSPRDPHRDPRARPRARAGALRSSRAVTATSRSPGSPPSSGRARARAAAKRPSSWASGSATARCVSRPRSASPRAPGSTRRRRPGPGRRPASPVIPPTTFTRPREYRRHLATVLTERALLQAFGRLGGP